MVAERMLVAEVTVRVFDRGPELEFHKDRRLFGPWWRYEAELVGEGAESGAWVYAGRCDLPAGRVQPPAVAAPVAMQDVDEQ